VGSSRVVGFYVSARKTLNPPLTLTVIALQ
jgi:hypothetical protein